MVDEGGFGLGDAVAVLVAEQQDAVRAGGVRAGLFHQLRLDLALDGAAGVVGAGTVALGHQDIPVGQHVEPARMAEAAGKFIDRQAVRRLGHHARRPALGLGDIDGRDEAAGRGHQFGIGADEILDVGGRRLGAAGGDQQQCQGWKRASAHWGTSWLVHPRNG